MTSNLLIGYPDIPQAAGSIDTNHDFATNSPVHNLKAGERYQIGKLATTTAVLTRLNFDLGATTKAANYLAIARADLARSANVGRVVVRGSSSSAFAPSSITGLKGWWDFTRDVTTATGISQVNDQSGLGNHLVQATGANQPAWTAATSGINDNKCATFDGTNDYLTCDNVATYFTGTDKPYTFFVVGSPASLAATESWGSFGRSSTATPYIDFQVNNGTAKINWNMRDDASASPANINSALALSNGTTYVWTFKTTGTAGTLYKNGASDASGAFDVNATTLDRFTVGALGRNAYTQFWNGKIGEVLIYDSALSDADRGTVEAYLISKWQTLAPVKTNTFAADTLYGQRSKDWYSTFTTSSAYRHWWIDYDPSATGTLDHSKVYLGSYFDFGKDPDDIQLQKIEVKQSKFYSPSGAVSFSKNEQTKYKISITWRGVTDDAVRDFETKVVNQTYRNRGVFLITTTDHNVLDGNRILHCYLTESESEAEKTDYNTVRAEFEEMIG